jgi:imidazolonepropionase-like amidohydrolase
VLKEDNPNRFHLLQKSLEVFVKNRFFIAALVLLAAPLFSESQLTCIKAGRMFDGDVLLDQRLIVIDGETITAVLDGHAEPPAGARIIDASTMTVTPGFVESHSHFFAQPAAQTARPETFGGKLVEQGYSLQPDNRLSLFRNGITAVVDMGCTIDMYLGMMREIEKGTLLCPELYFPGPLFTAPEGHPAGTIYKGMHFLIDSGTIQTADPREAERKVEELAARGVTFIKIVYDGRPGIPRLSLAVARAIIDRAHGLGLKVFAHVTSPGEASDMLNAGIDGIEHDFKDMPTLAPLMVEKGVFFTPTLQAFRTILPQYVPGLMKDIKAAYDAGVLVAVGTDYPTGPAEHCGDDYMAEMKLLEECGVPRLTVLHSATAVGAMKVGRGSDLGAIRAGYRANLIFFDGDITTGEITKDRIVSVMFHGNVILENGQPRDEVKQKFATRSLMITPYAYYDALNSFVLGGSLMDFDLFNTGTIANLALTCSIEAKVGADLALTFASPIAGTAMEANASFDTYSRMYYGIGNESPLSQAIEYNAIRARESLHASSRIVDHVSLDSRLSFRQQGSLAAVASVPAVPGLIDANETMLGLSLAYDRRDNPANPWYGFYISLGGDLSSRYLGSTNDFQSVSLDARVYLSPFTHWILAGRLLCRQAFGDVPPVFLPSFGGAEVGRGFAPARFADSISLASQLELRFPIASVLKGVVFADAGQVARAWQDLRIEGTHVAAGVGLRVFPSPDESTVLSYDVGFSREGWTFYFRYGHAF